MKLKELLNKVGDDNQIIMLLTNGEYVCAFPATLCPKEYDNYIVDCFMPDRFEGDSPFDGMVLKIWIKDTLFD